MVQVVNLEDVMATEGKAVGYVLLGEQQGCVNGCNCGVSIYTNDEYDMENAASHEDQEGFYVIEGSGKALIGGEEIGMKPGDSFMVPAHTVHAMKRNRDHEYCKVFWFHAAV